MRDRQLTPVERGTAMIGGYWCLPCNNACNSKREQHECAGPCVVGGRRVNCSCTENHDAS